MPKVLFELNFESVVHMESLTDYYSSLMNSTMLDFIFSSSVNMTKEFFKPSFRCLPLYQNLWMSVQRI